VTMEVPAAGQQPAPALKVELHGRSPGIPAPGREEWDASKRISRAW